MYSSFVLRLKLQILPQLSECLQCLADARLILRLIQPPARARWMRQRDMPYTAAHHHLAYNVFQLIVSQKRLNGKPAHQHNDLGVHQSQLAVEEWAAQFLLCGARPPITFQSGLAWIAFSDGSKVAVCTKLFLFPLDFGQPLEQALARRPTERTASTAMLARWRLTNYHQSCRHRLRYDQVWCRHYIVARLGAPPTRSNLTMQCHKVITCLLHLASCPLFPALVRFETWSLRFGGMPSASAPHPLADPGFRP
jgi:hypothetical protein